MESATILAIVIPYYKINFFKECLFSLASQTNQNFRVYIGDDNSPDDPSKLLKEFSSQLDIHYRKFSVNMGGISLTSQWERCIELCAEEEWILILGDDDVLGEKVVEDFYGALQDFNGKTDVVRFASQVINSSNEVVSKVFTHPKWERVPDSFFRWLDGKTRSSLSEHVFTKAAYKKNNFRNYPLGWHSDDMAWLDFPGNYGIFSINTSKVYVRHSAHNITTSQANLELKKTATSNFYDDLIREKLQSFNKPQRRKGLLKFEIFHKENKSMNMKRWIYLLFYYFKYGNLIDPLKLVRRFFLYQIRGKFSNKGE